ncbi:hypothetical protein Bbelb_372180, partial [Branchiostoma belcheri]
WWTIELSVVVCVIHRTALSSVAIDEHLNPYIYRAAVTTRRTCFCVLSTCKNVGKRRASVRGEYRLRTESYGFGSTQTRRRTLSACNTFSTCGLRIYHPCVRVRATRVPRTAYERATYGLLYKDDLTGDCQLVSKMPRKAQKKTTRQDPKKRAAEDTRAASDDEVNRRCTHLQRASTACTRQRGNRTEIVRCKHVQLTYHLRNVRCTQPLTDRRVVQTTPGLQSQSTCKATWADGNIFRVTPSSAGRQGVNILRWGTRQDGTFLTEGIGSLISTPPPGHPSKPRTHTSYNAHVPWGFIPRRCRRDKTINAEANTVMGTEGEPQTIMDLSKVLKTLLLL